MEQFCNGLGQTFRGGLANYSAARSLDQFRKSSMAGLHDRNARRHCLDHVQAESFPVERGSGHKGQRAQELYFLRPAKVREKFNLPEHAGILQFAMLHFYEWLIRWAAPSPHPELKFRDVISFS